MLTQPPDARTYKLCLRRGDAVRIVTRDSIRDRAGVWDDLVDQTLVHSPPAEWEFLGDGSEHSMVSRRCYSRDVRTNPVKCRAKTKTC